MPWLAHAEDAPDTHKMWADPGSAHEASLRAVGWRHEVPAPGPVLLTEDESEDEGGQDPPSEQHDTIEQPPPAKPPMPPGVALKRKRDRNA
ncbi:hypothetical protein Lesp02_70750 [Lentzea sp. NBRC 105346]|uniref:hypothetical protein n=1 Tax=Lentzea sp. NBRC 105346 TaxID=3032205 RepID=UPI0024A4E189|nr:hypothetical protein [Lentzea sp. NBRC 105346]GLZ34888.1 hypothetical protein Lesp02_70750 [Lentzea sp. NBRC 105346]